MQLIKTGLVAALLTVMLVPASNAAEVQRDYYVVRRVDGVRLWIYRERGAVELQTLNPFDPPAPTIRVQFLHEKRP